MKQRKWGRVIHISSVMGYVSKEKRNIYSATKSALIGFAQASALDLGEFGITDSIALHRTIPRRPAHRVFFRIASKKEFATIRL